MVPPGVRWRVVRDGRERGLHLRGLLPESRRGRRGRCGDGGRGGGRGERGGAGDIDVQRQRAESALVVGSRGFVVSRTIRLASKPSNFTSSSAAAGASAGQLALEKIKRARD